MPRKHTVAQGECLSSIAAHYGFADHLAIYDNAANAELKKKRPNPNVLLPGDVVAIPDVSSKTLSLATGKRYKIVVKRPPAVVPLEVRVAEPHFYELRIGDDKFEGKTDGKAPIEHAASPAAHAGRIELWPATDGNESERQGLFGWDLQIGSLDPADEISGVQGRLANLGYYAGPVDGDGIDNTDLAHAVARFETDQGLEVTGDASSASLQAKLRDLHDGK